VSVKDTTELKALRSRRDEAIALANQAKQRMTDAQRDYQEKKSKADGLGDRIRELEAVDSGIVVSEHAYLRWFERALGFDLAEVKKQMLSERVETMIQAMRTCHVKMGNGLTLVVKDKTIVSVVEDK
jgi:hypothetical protein